MSDIYENLIEYSGISEYIPQYINCYKELNLESTVNTPSYRPNIKEIIKVSAAARINSSRIILTPIGKSLEGQELTGKKYIIEGEANIRVDYLSDNEDNKVYCIHHKENFSSGIVLHKDIINSNGLVPSIFIEGINAELLSNKQVFVIITILSVVEK